MALPEYLFQRTCIIFKKKLMAFDNFLNILHTIDQLSLIIHPFQVQEIKLWIFIEDKINI